MSAIHNPPVSFREMPDQEMPDQIDSGDISKKAFRLIEKTSSKVASFTNKRANRILYQTCIGKFYRIEESTRDAGDSIAADAVLLMLQGIEKSSSVMPQERNEAISAFINTAAIAATYQDLKYDNAIEPSSTSIELAQKARQRVIDLADGVEKEEYLYSLAKAIRNENNICDADLCDATDLSRYFAGKAIETLSPAIKSGNKT